ncbi:uncharacterized protein LOC117178222 [Belonocnema kinseyi]|uniref:uncharacterized protein LOC117178222 n=1 Tax=Belonocnema kinseyi TaxID=2817044 RepID=UPI00143DA9BB|nr:uncharacterized protein LOC117178222 [Belonocnema kinseyi]
MSFKMLKDALCSAPVLRYPDLKDTFTLTTDAKQSEENANINQVDESQEVDDIDTPSLSGEDNESISKRLRNLERTNKKETTSESILKNLLDHYIYVFSSPEHILTDQGANFASELVQKLKNLFRINHIKTTALHPQSNGALERTHGIIKDLLKIYMADNETKWNQNLNLI